MSRVYYEAYDDRYRQIHKHNLRWFTRKPSEIVMEVIEEFEIGKNARILEIGCGEGRDAKLLLEQGYDLLATDISAEAIAFCRNEWPLWECRFQTMNCIGGELEERFDFIYAVAVVHMLVRDEDRNEFYRFLYSHLKENGIALICTMGDGQMERSSDISEAFDLQERVHEESGQTLWIAGTSYRAVSFLTFEEELTKNKLDILKLGVTDVKPDYWKMMYAVVRKG